MQRSTSILLIGGLAAAVAAAVIAGNLKSNSAPAPASIEFDSSAAIAERILALEAAVSEERRARQLLEDELVVLMTELDALPQPTGSRGPAAGTVAPADMTAVGNVADVGGQGAGELDPDAEQNNRREALVTAGLTPARADYILRREAEMQYEVMQAVYEARQSGQPYNRFTSGISPEAMLREEIGDADFARYLEANGRPTSVGVASVMPSSPAERAGLRAGDQIVSYNGERMFTSSELMRRTVGGDGGGPETVVVDLLRDGAPIQVVLPRGPIGIEIGRFRGR